MSVGVSRLNGMLSEIDPLIAVCLPIAVAPFGYLIGGLFVSHLVPSEIEAVWLSTVGLTVLAFLVVALRS